MNTITWSVTEDPGKWDVTIDGTTESISMDFYKAIVSHAQGLERAAITKWLRSLGSEANHFLPATLANWIEEGMHDI